MTSETAFEANIDGLIGPTHSYAGLSPGNLASAGHKGQVSNPRAAVLEGLTKMRRLADLGVPQFVLPPQARPDLAFLRAVGFEGSDAKVLESAWKAAPALAAAACSASAMWAANAATVTPSADTVDGRVHFTPANLLTNLHRSLEGGQTMRSLRRLFPDPAHFAVHAPLPAQPHFADEGAANHVRLCAEHGAPGVNLFVYGRSAWERWSGQFPARQTLEAFEAIARRHSASGAVFARQGQGAIDGGAFHNDVVCVGTRTCLFHHQSAFADTDAVYADIRKAAAGQFEPVFVSVSEGDLPLADAIQSYLFNSQLLVLPGEDRLVLLAPIEAKENQRAYAVGQALVASNGPIGRVDYVDVRQSMHNGGGPACLRLRVVLTPAELAATHAAQRLTPALHAQLEAWAMTHYRDRLAVEDLADPNLITEVHTALDALCKLLGLDNKFYNFQ